MNKEERESPALIVTAEEAKQMADRVGIDLDFDTLRLTTTVEPLFGTFEITREP